MTILKELLLNTNRNLLSLLVLFALVFVPSQWCSAQSITLTPKQSTMLLTVLDEQEKALNEALILLDEAQSQLDESETALTLSESELAVAKQELAKQKKELSALTMLLKKQSNELDLLSEQLTSANAYLEQAKAEFLLADKKHKQKENSLRCERTLWQIISIVLAGIAATN